MVDSTNPNILPQAAYIPSGAYFAAGGDPSLAYPPPVPSPPIPLPDTPFGGPPDISGMPPAAPPVPALPPGYPPGFRTGYGPTPPVVRKAAEFSDPSHFASVGQGVKTILNTLFPGRPGDAAMELFNSLYAMPGSTANTQTAADQFFDPASGLPMGSMTGQPGPPPTQLGSSGPVPRVPPSGPAAPGMGTPAAVAGPVAPPVSPNRAPTGPGPTPQQIFQSAALGHQDAIAGAPEPVAPVTPVTPAAAPASTATAASGQPGSSIWDDPGFEFGLRLMEASQPQQGSHRGPSIFAALAGAGLGQMQQHRQQIIAQQQFKLEQSKVEAQNMANILTAQSNAQFKELQAKIQAGQLDISKGQLRAEIEKNRDAEKAKNPFRIPGAGDIDEAKAKAFDADVDQRYDAQLDNLGVKDGNPTDPAGGGPVTTLRGPNGTLIQARYVNGQWVDTSGKPLGK